MLNFVYDLKPPICKLMPQMMIAVVYIILYYKGVKLLIILYKKKTFSLRTISYMKADINKDITTHIHNELSIRIKHRNDRFFLKQTNSDLIAQGPLGFFYNKSCIPI